MSSLNVNSGGILRNPRKKFNFLIEILGYPALEPFAAQNVVSPDLEIERTEHGIGNTVKGSPGLFKTGTLKIDRILTSILGQAQLTADIFLQWMYQVQNPVTLTGGDPLLYEKIIAVSELSNISTDGVNQDIINVTYYHGCWPIRINGKEYDRVSSDNLVESIEFSVDYVTSNLTPGTPTIG